MKQNKLKYLIIGLILFVTFLLDGPLWSEFIKILYFTGIPSNLLILFINFLYYIGLILCTIILTNEKFCLCNLIKISGIIIAFMIIESLTNTITNSEAFLSLVYSIVKPIITVTFICLAYKSVCKCRIIKNRKLTIAFIALFLLSTIFNIFKYFRVQTVMDSLNNEFYSYLTLLSSNNSIYAYLSQICMYGLIFIAFIWLEKSTENKKEC